MGLLPIEVPDIPEERQGIVPARLARKVAPLFGVPWPEGPFGARTWVCDYNKVTLSDIARGAPSPSRGQASWARNVAPADWAVVDRVGVTGEAGALPNVIPNATLNRFGPDTKAAVLLTAANRLLDPVTDAVAAALDALRAADGGPLPPRARVAAWAALVIEVFRTQPALLAAAIRARTVQRELLVDWHLPIAPSIAGLVLTRCEVSGPEPEDPPPPASHPSDLALVDWTVGLLDMPSDEVAARTADQLLRELIAIGTRRSSSHLWLSERVPDQLVVEALVPPTELVGRIAVAAAPGGSPILPAVPAARRLAGRSLLERRASVLAVLAVLRDLRFDAEGRERTRLSVLGAVDELGALADSVLGADDAAAVLVRTRLADMTVHTVRHDVRADLVRPVRRLRAAVERCITLGDRGVLDRGAVAEAVSSANVEINIVRRTNAARPGSGLPPPHELDEWLRETWSAFRRALQMPPQFDDGGWPAGPDDPMLPVGHHLHNYASYLATHPDSDDDLRAAVDLFTRAVLPAREQYHRYSGSFTPLRQSLQTASRATTTLSSRAMAAGDADDARRWAALGRSWIMRALADAEVTALLAGTSEPAAHLCLLAAPALLAAVETQVPESGPDDVSTAARLLATADRWAHRVTGGDVAHYTRAGELAELAERLRTLTAGRPSDPPAPRAATPGPARGS